MAKRKRVGLRYALNKIKDLEDAFGYDSDVVVHAKKAVEGKMDFLPTEYQNDDGSWNVGAIQRRYDELEAKIKSLEAKKANTGLSDYERQVASDQLPIFREERRQYKGVLNIGSAEVNQAIQTVPQMLGEEWKVWQKALKQKIKDKEVDIKALDKVELAVLNAKARKDILKNDEAVSQLKSRAEYTMRLAENYEQMRQDIYSIMRDEPDAETEIYKEGENLLNTATFNAQWMADASAYIIEHLGEQMYMSKGAFYS